MEIRLQSVKANQSMANYVEGLLQTRLTTESPPKTEYPAQDTVRSLESKVVSVDIPAVIPVKKSVLTRGVVAAVAATSSMTTESVPAPDPPGMTISEAPSGYGGVSSDVQHST